jgi:glycosyltransferase involved in cell wall biosynthesis
LQARKNLPRLVEAFGQLKREGIDGSLVLVGKPDWRSVELFNTVRNLNLESEVRFLGYVPGEDLPYLYNAASVFVFPSIFEGFGLPVLESMACGTPTITSCGSSLEEIAGDAALLVDPFSVASIRDAMRRLFCDPDLRHRLRESGLARAAQFSYKEAARQTILAYESI